MSVLSEEQLVSRACEGDPASFGELIRLWDADLRGVAWSVCRSASDTDDIMQRTWEKAFRSIDSFDGRSKLKTWVWSICRRTALDHIRYEGRRKHDPESAMRQWEAHENTSRDAADRMELSAVLDSLDPETRSLLMMTAGLGLSVDEAAEIAELPRGTAASRIRRARARLTSWDA